MSTPKNEGDLKDFMGQTIRCLYERNLKLKTQKTQLKSDVIMFRFLAIWLFLVLFILSIKGWF